MIRRVSITNFRCIESLDLQLGPLTALVGPNSSGKSSILQAMDFRFPLQPTDHRFHVGGLIEIGLQRENGGREKRQFASGSHPTGHYSQFGFQFIHLRAHDLRQANTVKAENRLSATGNNLANVFATLTRSQQSLLAKELCKLVPTFGDVDVRPTESPGQHALVFQDRWRPGLWYGTSEVSDGTMLLLGFLALQHQTPPVDVIAIEEPERGLHPYLIGQLVTMLRKLSKGELGPRPIQVLLATHSAELLDFLQPEEVRFVTRSPENGQVVVEQVPTDSPDWKASFAEYRNSLGQAWLSGGLGGVP